MAPFNFWHNTHPPAKMARWRHEVEHILVRECDILLVLLFFLSVPKISTSPELESA